MTRSDAADEPRSKRAVNLSSWPGGAPGMPGTAKLKVLLIDDEVEQLLPLADVLRRAGLAPMIATSDDEALFHVETSPPDVVVIDAEMAERSLLWRLRVVVSNLPCVLMISVSAHDAQLAPMLAIAGVACVEKPVDARHLIRLLSDVHRFAAIP
jgi:DNA-binding response OmpR family regulator